MKNSEIDETVKVEKIRRSIAKIRQAETPKPTVARTHNTEL